MKDVIRNSRKSSKCDCQAKFQFDTHNGIRFSGEHNDLCSPLSDREFQSKGYVMKMLQSPDKHASFENLAVTCMSDWGSSKSNVAQIIEKEVIKRSYSMTSDKNVRPPHRYIHGILN